PFSAPTAVAGGFIQSFGQTTFTQGYPTSGRAKSVKSAIPVLPNSIKVWGHTGTLEWQAADNLTIKSITGYRILHNDAAGTNIPTGSHSIITRFAPTID